jgi:hypothetical protein
VLFREREEEEEEGGRDQGGKGEEILARGWVRKCSPSLSFGFFSVCRHVGPARRPVRRFRGPLCSWWPGTLVKWKKILDNFFQIKESKDFGFLSNDVHDCHKPTTCSLKKNASCPSSCHAHHDFSRGKICAQGTFFPGGLVYCLFFLCMWKVLLSEYLIQMAPCFGLPDDFLLHDESRCPLVDYMTSTRSPGRGSWQLAGSQIKKKLSSNHPGRRENAFCFSGAQQSVVISESTSGSCLCLQWTGKISCLANATTATFTSGRL